MGSQDFTSIPPIHSSNLGYQLLQKHGWKEGRGLGASEQGRLDPIEAIGNQNKRGLGADQPKATVFYGPRERVLEEENSQDKEGSAKEEEPRAKKCEKLSQQPKKLRRRARRRMRKVQQLEQDLKDKEFRRAFYREFWPDNV